MLKKNVFLEKFSNQVFLDVAKMIKQLSNISIKNKMKTKNLTSLHRIYINEYFSIIYIKLIFYEQQKSLSH